MTGETEEWAFLPLQGCCSRAASRLRPLLFDREGSRTGLHCPKDGLMSTDGSVMFATKEAMRQQVGKLFADSPDLDTTIASQIVIGQLAGDEEQISAVSSAICRPRFRSPLAALHIRQG